MNDPTPTPAPQTVSVVANGVTVTMTVKTDLGDDEYVLLEAVNGDLTGEEPGMYYPVPHAVV